MLVVFFSVLALVIVLGLTVFQIALICGAPLGHYAWGGQHRVLPTRLRVSSIASVVLYVIFALTIASKAGFITGLLSVQTVTIALYIFAAYFTVGIALNALSKSKKRTFCHDTGCCAACAMLLGCRHCLKLSYYGIGI